MFVRYCEIYINSSLSCGSAHDCFVFLQLGLPKRDLIINRGTKNKANKAEREKSREKWWFYFFFKVQNKTPLQMEPTRCPKMDWKEKMSAVSINKPYLITLQFCLFYTLTQIWGWFFPFFKYFMQFAVALVFCLLLVLKCYRMKLNSLVNSTLKRIWD